MKNAIQDTKRRAEEVRSEMATINETAAAEGRDLNETETAQWDTLKGEAERLQRTIDRSLFVATLPIERPEPGEVRQAPAIHQRRTPDTPEGIYCRYLRTGDMGTMAELRAYQNTDMNVTTAGDGEVVVPVGMVQDIVARRDEMMLAPKLGVRRIPGKGTTVNYPIDNEADVLFLVEAESADIDQDAPELSEKAFTLAKYAKYITLTWELLRDEDANLMSFLNNWVARGWAATHNKLLVTEVTTNGTAGLTVDSATAIGAAEIPELIGKLMPEYQDGAQWIMHPTTYAYLSGLKGDAFQFAPTPGGGLAGPTLWGYPLNRSSYATAYAGSAKSMVFGNFNFLGMREGTGLTTLRDPYSVASKGQIRLWFWFDAVYGVLQAEAIQYATHPTA